MLRKRRLWVFAVCLGALLLAPFALDRLFPPNLTRLHAVGAEVQDRDGRILSVLPAPGGFWRLATRPEDVSPILLDLLIAAEDRRFYQHPGIDPLALGRAAGSQAGSILRHQGHVIRGRSIMSSKSWRVPLGGFPNSDKLRQYARYWRARDEGGSHGDQHRHCGLGTNCAQTAFAGDCG